MTRIQSYVAAPLEPDPLPRRGAGRIVPDLDRLNQESMSTYKHIGEILRNGSATVLLDGAMGAELVRRGVRWRWHGLRTDPEKVQALHEEYIAAGADVIRTNTFQLNARLYRNVFRNAEHMRHIGAPGLETRAAELAAQAVAVARGAREKAGHDVAVAGVMAPLEHCFRPDLAPNAKAALPEQAEIADMLAEAGVDLLILESMNTLGEARAAAEAALGTGLPVWASFVLGPEGEILSGEPLREGVQALESMGVEVILINCVPPEDATRALKRIREFTDQPLGAYAQIGKFDPPSWKFEFHPQFSGTEAWPPERYAETARGWRDAGARVVGGCCGTGPDHIRALREAL